MKNVEGYVGHTDLFKVDPRKIVICEGWNPRTVCDRASFDNLKLSIRDNGFYPDKPLLLYRNGSTLELIDGYRRYCAVMELIAEGVPFVAVPAVLDQTGDIGERLARALSANQNSVPLDLMDEARAFQRLTGYGWESKRIAEKIGRSLSYVYGRLKLLEATTDVLDAASRGEITQTDIVRTVERANREGTSQVAVLDQTIQKRKVSKASPKATAETDERTMMRLLDEYGVAWVVSALLNYTDKAEVIDAIHEAAGATAASAAQ